MSKVGDFLKKYRMNMGMKQTEVWKAIDIKDSVLSNLENGKTQNPDPLVLKKLAIFYNINPIKLYVLAGYLDEPIGMYEFNDIDKLSENEISHIQQLINLFNENRTNKIRKEGEYDI